MGLFRKIGRQVEQFKSEAEAAAEDYTAQTYRCGACDARFEERHEQCPECGSEDVAPAETEQ